MKQQKKSQETDKKPSAAAEKELAVLAFWKEHNIFEQSLSATADGAPFVFYDGPPFATGLPHYGHLLQGTLKDAIPRYQTMKGRHVRRQWGWDCHGLPIENLVEEELGLESKQDIEKYGVEKFNEAACNSVMRYDKEWKDIVPRMGRWIDMEDSYKTMDWQYSESVWWAFKQLWDKEYIYEGYKSMHICPRCETTLSINEVADGYKDIKDLSVTAKFELVDEPGTFVLAWTTTPWTLPGNVALAVGEDIEYQKIKTKDKSDNEERVIIAKERVEEVMKDMEYEIDSDLTGADLVGKTYKPLFDYYAKDKDIENRDNGWKVYAADFVTTEDGTGVVHIAPAFGEDDMNMGKEHKLPFVQHVTMSGRFKEEVTDFPGLQVKPRDDHMSTDILIVKHLAHAGTLFAKEKYEHSYPHCWRCKTPLLNYAATSWFVKVTEFRNKLLKENEKITWIPETIQHGRFGNWLEGARDWAISRSRYWGAPFPVWRNDETGETQVIGSLEELHARVKRSGNTYRVIRHGQAESNVAHRVSSKVDGDDPVTEEGEKQIKESAAALVGEGIDLIFASPFMRTRMTAQMVAAEIGLEADSIIYDDRLVEVDTGDLHGGPTKDYAGYASHLDKFTTPPPGGETLNDIKRRMGEFIFELEEKYHGKNILIVSHEFPIWLLFASAAGWLPEEAVDRLHDGHHFIDNAEVRELPFARYPHNRNYEVDFHRPYIDNITLEGEQGGVLSRIPDVFDCWFESGSMPFAQFHYPFENEKLFNEIQSPADFIAEAVDQTRSWFYYLLVLSAGVFDKASFKNVIVSGIILADDGQKMSKSLKNYPDPMELVGKYGADAMRYYLLSSPVVRAESLNFSEQGVAEVYRKVIVRLENVVSFYEMFSERRDDTIDPTASTDALDQWILSRLAELVSEVGTNLDTYELDRATRPIGDFVDDLSTWYVRRSRVRMKGEGDDAQAALSVLHFVLQETAKVIAPSMPFTAESIWQKIRATSDPESVHLATWPTASEVDADILDSMALVRRVVSLALENRASAGIKVRQPLALLSIKDDALKGEQAYIDLIADEVNVKEVTFDTGQEADTELDLEITPILKREGQYRELVRNIQGLRKTDGLTPDDRVTAHIETGEDGRKLIEAFEEDLKRTTVLGAIIFEDTEGKEVSIDDMDFTITLTP